MSRFQTSLLISLLMSFSPVFATALGANFGPSLEDRIGDSIRTYRLKNRHSIPAGSECEKILVQAGKNLGRTMTREEIDQALEKILLVTSEKLIDTRLRGCFAENMKVLTPDGERPIVSLRPPETVYSVVMSPHGIDLKANRIVAIHSLNFSDIGEFLDLPTPVALGHEQKISVMPSREWKFNLSQASSFEVRKVPDGSFLIYANAKRWLGGRKPKLIPFEGLSRSDRMPAICLELSDDPHNMIVNGLLVNDIGKD